MGPKQVQSLRFRVDLEVILMKGYWTITIRYSLVIQFGEGINPIILSPAMGK